MNQKNFPQLKLIRLTELAKTLNKDPRTLKRQLQSVLRKLSDAPNSPWMVDKQALFDSQLSTHIDSRFAEQEEKIEDLKEELKGVKERLSELE